MGAQYYYTLAAIARVGGSSDSILPEVEMFMMKRRRRRFEFAWDRSDGACGGIPPRPRGTEGRDQGCALVRPSGRDRAPPGTRSTIHLRNRPTAWPLLTLLSSACHLSVQFTMRFAWRRTALSSCVACDGKDEVAAGRCRWKREHIIIQHAALQRAQRARRFRRVTGRHYHRLIPAM